LDSPLRSNRSNLFQGTQRLGNSQQFAKSSASKKEADDFNHHFLEDFSDVEVEQNSKDPLGNTMDMEGDLIFNNKSNSLQNSTILSNKLAANIKTPLGVQPPL
jgi:hypothetical protein